jgi:hypothetical protein
VTVKSLAAVLAHAPELKERVVPRLSGGVAEWLVQEIELCGRLANDVLESERRKVLDALSKAVRDGRINLQKGVDVEPPPEEPGAQPALEAPSEAPPAGPTGA